MINYKLNCKIKTFLIILLLTLSNNAFAQFSAPSETPEPPKQKPELGYVGESEEQVMLKRLFSEPPYFPRKALRLGYEGYVLIEFDVDTDGAVLDPYVVESNPAGIFERSAIKAVRKWVYEAPKYQGQSVKVNSVQVRLNFNLD
tara:strand:- start:3752 stop:4183 length:432 start_codon:yes stop_codon:yes gene_type:complete